jgi:hypothetical protein
MPQEPAPAKAHNSAAPPSFLSITIGRFRVTSLRIPRKPFKVNKLAS